MCSTELGMESIKNKKNRFLDIIIFYPFAPPVLLGRFVLFILTLGHTVDLIIQVKL